MQKQKQLFANIVLVMLVVAGWFALIAQFSINMHSKLAPVPELIARYFSYFTITTNIIVAMCSTSLLVKTSTRLCHFFAKQQTIAAVAIYILIVGLIYNVILRFLWQPKGLQLLVDELLHSAIPILFTGHWLLFVAKDQLKWTSVFPWLIYPFIYLVWVLLHGAYSGFYPYPFINVGELGYEKMFTNALIITIILIAIALLFVAIGKFANRKRSVQQQ